jgi:hypothetical protein
MSLAEVLSLITGFLGVILTIIMAAETRLVKRLRKAGATSQEKAIALPRLRPLVRWQLSQLTSTGAVVAVEPQGHYLDEAGFRLMQRKRARRTVPLVLVVVALVVTAYLMKG